MNKKKRKKEMPVRKTGGGFKDKVASLFKKSTPKDYGKQTVYG